MTYYTLSATGRTPSTDPTGCCCPICGAVTWLVWSVLIFTIGSLFFGVCFGSAANIIIFAFTAAVGAALGLTKTDDFSLQSISYTKPGGEELSETSYTVAYCCFGLKERKDDATVDPEAGETVVAPLKPPTVPIPKKAYLTAMKKSHGLL
mmetsp:Transcript_51567/g.167760  ORF Transcript_51567/g.167760 Transcript_51567/m.167760 type:complete len:150 (-) Transcript_51567:273-722(-)